MLIKGGWGIVNGCLTAAEQIKSIRFACRLIWDGEEYRPRNCIENIIGTSIVQVCWILLEFKWQFEQHSNCISGKE